jgi:ribosome-associated protein
VPALQYSVDLAVSAVRAADDKKAHDLAILEVADILVVVDLFVLATTGSDRQLKAVADEIERVLREEHDRKPSRREGTADSGWVLLDYGDIVCHLFSTEQREFYSLERLWADVPRRDIETGERVGGSGGVGLGDDTAGLAEAVE